MTQIADDLSPLTLTMAIEENMFAGVAAGRRWPQVKLYESDEIQWSLTHYPYPMFNSVMRARLAPERVDIAIETVLALVNAFLVLAGDGYILIDTGTAQQWNRLEAELLKAGCLPDKLKLVVITHGDFDHTGNCANLQKKYQTKIAMHRADTAMVKSGKFVRRQTKTVVAKFFQLLGEFMGRRNQFETFEPDVLLEDGQSLDEYSLAAKIIHTPGHTQGSIAILTETGHLFVGDTLANQIRIGLAPFADDFQELGRSITKLKTLQAKVIYPGHGKPFPFESLLAITA